MMTTMIIVLSPAKTLDFESPVATRRHTQPQFLDESAELVAQLRSLDSSSVARLMSVSPALAELNVQRFSDWSRPFTTSNARQALLAFAGDVYEGLQAQTLDEDALSWAQSHVRVLSGLYGLLRPLDLMQPYRLEMGTRFVNSRGRDLYAFWAEVLARTLSESIRTHAYPVLVNLASEEYFKAVSPRALKMPVVQPVFQEQRADGYKVISFMAKRARGLMTRYAIDRRLDDPEALKAFDVDGYRYCEAPSDSITWIFRRD
jgi:cytoplasmic iron level regulating protein YaaA (DUF328/UPF0246 family)